VKSAQRLLEYAHARGVRACFANPGTSEMQLVYEIKTQKKRGGNTWKKRN
jgi:thiamine pyrophosphate-dependent acetolactate synthase large subunit-like protein